MKMISNRVFENRIKKVMEHNDYSVDMITTKICNAKERWTPIDLILREYYNNGCGSSKGFLGISPKECRECVEYIIINQKDLKEKDLYNKDGYNNFGFPLWENYELYYYD